MIGKPLQRVVSFRTIQLKDGNSIFPKKKLKKMCSQMVYVVLHPKSHDLDVIGLLYKYLNIRGEKYEEFILRFLEA